MSHRKALRRLAVWERYARRYYGRASDPAGLPRAYIRARMSYYRARWRAYA